MVKYPAGVQPLNLNIKNAQERKEMRRLTGHKSSVSFSDRGMTLEQELNETNQYYLAQEMAVVHKKPTPVQIVKVDYPARARAVIREAYFRQASTTDYNGVYQGYYLDFEAKETRNKRSFPLKNFHEHQVAHLEACLKQGGICFTVIKFVTLQRYFIVPASVLIKAWRSDARSSMTLRMIEQNSIEIHSGYRPPLPYLPAVVQLIKQKEKLHD